MNGLVVDNLTRNQNQLSEQQYSEILNSLNPQQFQEYLCSSSFFNLWTDISQDKKSYFIDVLVCKQHSELNQLSFFMEQMLSICKNDMVQFVYKELLDTIDCNLILH